MAAFRYLDVVLVLATFPFAVLLGVPALGYGVGAGAWIAQRAIGAFAEQRAKAAGDFRVSLGVNLAAVFARAWLVGLAILVVGLQGSDDDGLTAAVLILAAFTLYFATSLLLRPVDRKGQPRKGVGS